MRCGAQINGFRLVLAFSIDLEFTKIGFLMLERAIMTPRVRSERTGVVAIILLPSSNKRPSVGLTSSGALSYLCTSSFFSDMMGGSAATTKGFSPLVVGTYKKIYWIYAEFSYCVPLLMGDPVCRSNIL